MPEPPDDFDNLWVEILDEWDKAEQAIKQAEMVSSEVSIPSINELRYAGRRLVDALRHKDKDPIKARDLLRDARFDCQRARHDAIDCATSFMNKMVITATGRFSASNIRDNFPDLIEFRTQLIDAQNKISRSRHDRENRNAIYDVIRNTDLDRLISSYQRLEASEDFLTKTAEEEKRAAEEAKKAAEEAKEEAKKDKRRDKITTWGSLVVGIASVLVALLAVLIRFG